MPAMRQCSRVIVGLVGGYMLLLCGAAVFMAHVYLAFGQTRRLPESLDVLGAHGIVSGFALLAMCSLGWSVWQSMQHKRPWMVTTCVVLMSFPGFVGCWIGLYAAMISFNML